MSTLIKKGARSEFRNLIAALRVTMLDGKRVFTFAKNKYRYVSLMRILQNEGFIESFEERGDFLVVRLKQTYGLGNYRPVPAFMNISKVTRMRRKDTINLRDISRMQRYQGQIPCFLLSTDKGILTGPQASSKKVGGIPLFRII